MVSEPWVALAAWENLYLIRILTVYSQMSLCFLYRIDCLVYSHRLKDIFFSRFLPLNHLL